jgi:hypothetical protein
MLGYTFDELQHTAQQWADFVHPNDRERAWASIFDVSKGAANPTSSNTACSTRTAASAGSSTRPR